jgi:hypothetical protein
MPPTCACGVNDTNISNSSTGAANTVDLAGRPRILLALDQGGIEYFECTAGCAGPNPLWSIPVTLSIIGTGGGNTAPLRPALATTAQGGLVAAFRDQPNGQNASRLMYSECPSGTCNSPAAWQSLPLTALGGIRSGSGVDLDSEGPLRAIVFEHPDAGGVWAECSSNCAADAGNWTFFESRVPSNNRPTVNLTGGVRRAMFANTLGGQNTGIAYLQCVGATCPGAGWTSARVTNAGTYPDMTLDSHGTPIAFAVSGGGATPGLLLLRCANGACNTNNAWTSTSLNGATGTPLVGNAPDGRAFVISGAGTTFPLPMAAPVAVAIELPDAGFTLGGLSVCGRSGLTTTDDPGGYLSAPGRWRIIHTPSDVTFNESLNLFWQLP